MIKTKKIITKSEKETLALGQAFAKKITGGQVLAFFGNLGAGKTVFIKGIAKGLGIKKIITSPTFVLMKVYPIKNQKTGLKNLIHIDCYRTGDADQIKAIGATEYFLRPDSLVVIEWAEKIKPLLPKKLIRIKITLQKDNSRQITIW